MLSLTFCKLYVQLDELDRVAQKIIQKEMPPDESVVLKLTDIMLDTSGCYGAFALGYDVGETTVGQLYVLVSLMKNLRLNKMLYMKRFSVLVSNGAVCIAELSRESIGCQYGKA